MGNLYWDYHPVMYIRLQIRVDICVATQADAVTNGDVNCYNCVVRLRSLPRFTETLGER